jgi:predicted ATP-grasp superfamily ATP-dependent carboligase
MEGILMLEVSNVALVLGGHINGYSIIRELKEEGISNIALFDTGKSIARYSNKVNYVSVINQDSNTLLHEIENLHRKFERIVIFPTDDLHLINLHAIYSRIKSYCYIPFNEENILKTLDKFFQYDTCNANGIPYPKTLNAKCENDFIGITKLSFPLLIKPSTRKDITTDVFRTLFLESFDDYRKNKGDLIGYMESGIEFVVSEYIPGDDTNIYAYTCFRSQKGEILNEWIGKKLTQYPDNYGVFCSASNEAPEIIREQGRALVEALNSYGIIEPEFKFDCRDGKYKLMEVNLRSMMWHRTGSISGVKLQKTQMSYALGMDVDKYSQNLNDRYHFVLMLHEIPNLITRSGYWPHFKYNIFRADHQEWAVYSRRDLKPFVFGMKLVLKAGVMACLKRLGLK